MPVSTDLPAWHLQAGGIPCLLVFQQVGRFGNATL